ncbi:hypothetical protein GTR02_00210 [Kineococcus sp. R8]|nr:hypothetical protein [Kineococcus siccus]
MVAGVGVGRGFAERPTRRISSPSRRVETDIEDTTENGARLVGAASTGVMSRAVANAADVLAYSDRTGTSDGPTEAIGCRLEHLHGSPLGFG